MTIAHKQLNRLVEVATCRGQSGSRALLLESAVSGSSALASVHETSFDVVDAQDSCTSRRTRTSSVIASQESLYPWVAAPTYTAKSNHFKQTAESRARSASTSA